MSKRHCIKMPIVGLENGPVSDGSFKSQQVATPEDQSR